MTNLGLALLFWTFITVMAGYVAGSEVAYRRFKRRSNKHV